MTKRIIALVATGVLTLGIAAIAAPDADARGNGLSGKPTAGNGLRGNGLGNGL